MALVEIRSAVVADATMTAKGAGVRWLGFQFLAVRALRRLDTRSVA